MVRISQLDQRTHYGRHAVCVALCTILLMAGSPTATARESSQPSGAKIYTEAGCSICHGGLGYGGAGPRLRGGKLLSADTYVVGQILIGRGIMPAFADKLSNAEIAAVATYIRTSWGNTFGPVGSERVAEIRACLADQDEKKVGEGRERNGD